MRTPRFVVVALVSAAALIGGTGCDVVPASNPFDPAAPPEIAAAGGVFGVVELPRRDLAAAPITLIVTHESGREVTAPGGDRFTTLGPDDAIPDGVDGVDNVDNVENGTGTFDIPLAPGSYTLAFDPALNDEARYEAAEASVVVVAGARVRRDLRPVERDGESFTGGVTGVVDVDDVGAIVVVALRPVGRAAGDAGLAQQQTLVGGGTFSFVDVADGDFVVEARSDGAVPTASAQFSIAGAGLALPRALQLVPVGDVLFVAEHADRDDLPPFSPFLPSLSAHVGIDGGLLVLDDGDFVEARATGARFTDPLAGWLGVAEPLAVTLDDGADGARTISAQVRVCFDGRCACDPSAEADGCDGFRPALVSSVLTLDVVVDREAPELVAGTIDGAPAAGPSAPGAGDADGPATITLACASFGGLCPLPAGTAPRVPALDVTLVDVTGRVRAWGASVDDDVIDDDALAVLGAGSVARIRDVGPAIFPVDGSQRLRLVAEDAAGNRAVVVDAVVVVDVTAPPPPGLVIDGLAGFAPTLRAGRHAFEVVGEAARVRVDVGPGDATVRGDLIAGPIGAGARNDVATGPHDVVIDGPHRATVVVTPVALDDAGNERAGLAVTLTVEQAGALVGRFVLAGREQSNTQNGGVQVSVVDARGAVVAVALTAADGSWRVDGVVVDVGYRVVGFFPGFSAAEVQGVAVVGGVGGVAGVTVVEPDAAGAATGVVLDVAGAGISLCAPTQDGLASDPCAPLSFTNLRTLQVSGLDLDGVTATRVATTSFAAADAAPAFVAVVDAGAGPRAPVVSLAGVSLAGGSVTVFFQTQSGAARGEVQTATIVVDETPPGAVVTLVPRVAGALFDGVTAQTAVDVDVDAAADGGAPLARLCAVFSATTPTSLPAGAVCASSGSLTVPLDSTAEGLHDVYGFACDAADNCSVVSDNVAARARVLLDRTPPRLDAGTGAAVAPAVASGAFDGTRFHIAARQHDVDVDVGVGPAGPAGALPEIAAVRLALTSAAAQSAPTLVLGAAAGGEARPTAPLFSGAADASYAVFVDASDAAGNRTAVPLSYQVLFDPTPPRLALTVPATTRLRSPAFTLTDLDGQPLVSATLQAATTTLSPVINTPTASLSGSFDFGADGSFVLTAVARDRAGNVGAVSREVVVDGVAPDAPGITQPVAGAITSDNTPTLRFTDVVDAAAYEITVKQGAAVVRGPTFVTQTERTETIALPDGAYVVEVRAFDGAGNASAAAGAAFVVDTTPPTGMNGLAVVPSPSPIADNTPTLGAQLASDALTPSAQLSYRLLVASDAGFNNVVVDVQRANVTSAFGREAPTPLADGTWFWRLEATDLAGNVLRRDGPSFTIDATAPAAPVINAVAAVVSANLPVTWSAITDAAKYRVRFETGGGNCGTTTSPQAAEPTATSFSPVVGSVNGCNVRVTVASVDAAGNQSPDASVSYRIDNVAPTLPPIALSTTGGGPSSITPSAIVQLGIFGNSNRGDAASLQLGIVESARPCVAQASVDAVVGTAAAVSLPAQDPTPITLSGSDTAGAQCKTVGVRVLDAAGNASAVSRAVIELDTTPPTAPTLKTGATTTAQTTFGVELAALGTDLNAVTHQVLRNGVVVATTPSTSGACAGTSGVACFNVPLAQNSENTIAVRAVDVVGNRSESALTFIRHDGVAPDAPVVSFRVGDQRAFLQWSVNAADVAGVAVVYTRPPTDDVCPLDPATYLGSFADQGNSPLALAANTRSVNLTGLPNGFPVCAGVIVNDEAGNAASAVVGPFIPNSVGLTREARISTVAQLGFPTTATFQALAVRRGLVYAAVLDFGPAGGANVSGLYELDLSNPGCFNLTSTSVPLTFAQCTGLLRSSDAGVPLVDPRSLLLVGEHVVVADGAGGTVFYKIVEGTSLTRVASIANGGGGKVAQGLAVNGNVLVVGRTSSVVRAFDGQAEVYDLNPLYQTVPVAPTLRSVIGQSTGVSGQANPFGDPARGIFGVTSVDVQGGLLGVGSWLWDITNPSAPTVIGAQPQEGNPTVRFAGGTLLSADEDGGNDNDLRAINIASCFGACPTSSRGTGVPGVDLEVLGPYLFSAGRGRLNVYDISDRSGVELIARYDAYATAVEDAGNRFKNEGDVAVEGRRVYFTPAGDASLPAGTSVLDIFETGTPERLEIIAAEGIPNGGFGHVVLRDAILQNATNNFPRGTAEEAVLRLTRTGFIADFINASAVQGLQIVEDANQLVFLRNNNTAEVTARSTNGFGTRTAITLSGSVGAPTVVGGAVSWPWLVVQVQAGGRQRLEVYKIPGSVGLIAPFASVDLVLGRSFNAARPSGVVVYGGNIYAAVCDANFGVASSNNDMGLFQMTFNPSTGALGVPQRIETQPTTTVHQVGREILTMFDGSASRGQLRANRTVPGTSSWLAGNSRLLRSNLYTFQHPMTTSGNVVALARDLDGFSFGRLRYDASGRGLSLDVFEDFVLEALAERVVVTGDRMYLVSIGAATTVARTP